MRTSKVMTELREDISPLRTTQESAIKGGGVLPFCCKLEPREEDSRRVRLLRPLKPSPFASLLFLLFLQRQNRNCMLDMLARFCKRVPDEF